MERKTYCDYLRLIATFAVVVLHVAASNWYFIDVNGFEWQSFNFYDSVVRWGVPIFVMVSGSLFLSRDISIRKIYSKYIFRMVIAFLTWSIFYALMTPEYFENGLLYGIKTHIDAMVSGHYHMWFILMIIGIYMCIPFYKKIIADSFTTKYFLVLSFIFAVMIPWSIQLLNDFIVENHEQLANLVSVANSHVSTMNMNMVLGYSFYFVLGYYLDNIELRKKQRLLIYFLGILGFAFTVLADLDLAIKTQKPCGTYYGNFRVNVMLEAICIHTLFKYHKFKNEKLNSFVFMISGYTFGAYLIHAFFIEKLSLHFNFNTLSFNSVASVPIVSAVVFICSLFVSIVLNHIPIIKKYCV
ncbi:acyltransferase family protein [uncultured Gemmiger sp.]|uniref:acyltransferase n=1 Tax=uncultured Gemmiger sp. TaxID=1623490 RepID=UPI0025D6D1A9|nr:acyltransferase family protein [uncultured Gemmiger sp.]